LKYTSYVYNLDISVSNTLSYVHSLNHSVVAETKLSTLKISKQFN